MASGPVYSFQELTEDPHFRARCVYNVEFPDVGTLTLTATPVKIEGQQFDPPLAPFFGQHTDDILGGILGIGTDELRKLAADGIIARFAE